MASLQLGTRWEKFYLQGSGDWIQRDYFPLSGNFPLQKPAKASPSYQTTYDRNHADSQDAKYNARIAFNPLLVGFAAVAALATGWLQVRTGRVAPAALARALAAWALIEFPIWHP